MDKKMEEGNEGNGYALTPENGPLLMFQILVCNFL